MTWINIISAKPRLGQFSGDAQAAASKRSGRRAIFDVTGFHDDYKDQVFQDLTCINLDTSKTPPTCAGCSLVNRNIGASRILGQALEGKFALPATLLATKITKGEAADSRVIDCNAGGSRRSSAWLATRCRWPHASTSRRGCSKALRWAAGASTGKRWSTAARRTS